MMTRRMLAALGAAALLLTLPIASATAATPKPMGPRMLEQMVLRMQFPTTLGTWEQSMYQTDKGARPSMCWTTSGAEYQLPASMNSGSVNYQVGQNSNGWVAVYQYKTAAQAAAALKALRNNKCSDVAKVPDESQMLMDAQQGSDFTDDTRRTFAVNTTYRTSDGLNGYASTITSQKGIGVYLTQVRTYIKGTQTLTEQQDTVSKLSDLNKTWHKRVGVAYQNFGVEGVTR